MQFLPTPHYGSEVGYGFSTESLDSKWSLPTCCILRRACLLSADFISVYFIRMHSLKHSLIQVYLTQITANLFLLHLGWSIPRPFCVILNNWEPAGTQSRSAIEALLRLPSKRLPSLVEDWEWFWLARKNVHEGCNRPWERKSVSPRQNNDSYVRKVNIFQVSFYFLTFLSLSTFSRRLSES